MNKYKVQILNEATGARLFARFDTLQEAREYVRMVTSRTRLKATITPPQEASR